MARRECKRGWIGLGLLGVLGLASACGSSSNRGAPPAPAAATPAAAGTTATPVAPSPGPASGPVATPGELVLHVELTIPASDATIHETIPLDPSGGTTSGAIELAPLDRRVSAVGTATLSMWLERVPGERLVEGGAEVSLVPMGDRDALDATCVGDGGPTLAWGGWTFRAQSVCRERRLDVTAARQ